MSIKLKNSYKNWVQLGIGVMLACCAVLAYGCKEDEKDIAVTGVSVDPSAVTFTTGEPQSVTATVLPREANQKVTWASLDTSVATVDSVGLITPVAVGSTTVTATSEADKTKEASVAVTVDAAVFRVKRVTIEPKSVTLEVDETVTVTAKIFPELADRQVTWRSQNMGIATVKDGVIKGVWGGTTNIIATSAVRPSIADTLSVTVNPRVYPPYPLPQPDFTFNGSMSKEVLRAYASRAVTAESFCGTNPIFEEDLRMIRRIGAKYIGRAAMYDWSGNMSAEAIEEHFKIAQEQADRAHQADPELILQAGVFEIVYRATANNTAIPARVFQAFDLPVESRNFRYDDIIFPPGHGLTTGYWAPEAAVPKIALLETQMYFYYRICRYIDAGYEAIHLGQVELMMDGKNAQNAVEWDRVTTLARAYAKKHARRGIALFDGHVAGGLKVGNRLVLDLHPGPLFPNETKNENGVMKCSIVRYDKCGMSWIGRSRGGEHPLGFTIDNNIAILEFDNYGAAPKEIVPGQATSCAFWNWGFDDISWFALQPEWYRNQFLRECDAFLKSTDLDSEGKQVYFLQPAISRTLVAGNSIYPKFDYKPGEYFNADFVKYYFGAIRTDYTYNAQSDVYNLTIKGPYHGNRQSDGCPNGFGQEDAIREIFLGKDAPEDPELLKVVFPPAYARE